MFPKLCQVISVVKILFVECVSITNPDLYKKFQQTVARDIETWKIGR